AGEPGERSTASVAAEKSLRIGGRDAGWKEILPRSVDSALLQALLASPRQPVATERATAGLVDAQPRAEPGASVGAVVRSDSVSSRTAWPRAASFARYCTVAAYSGPACAGRIAASAPTSTEASAPGPMRGRVVK